MIYLISKCPRNRDRAPGRWDSSQTLFQAFPASRKNTPHWTIIEFRREPTEVIHLSGRRLPYRFRQPRGSTGLRGMNVKYITWILSSDAFNSASRPFDGFSFFINLGIYLQILFWKPWMSSGQIPCATAVLPTGILSKDWMMGVDLACFCQCIWAQWCIWKWPVYYGAQNVSYPSSFGVSLIIVTILLLLHGIEVESRPNMTVTSTLELEG